MSRSDQYVGLNDYARELLRSDPPTSEETYAHIEGAWDPQVAPLRRYTLTSDRVLEERVQITPWASGPLYLVALYEERMGGEAVKGTLWSDDDIEDEIGYSGEWTSQIARQLADKQMHRALAYLQRALADEDGIAVSCAAERIALAARSLRCELGPDVALSDAELQGSGWM